MCWSENSDPRFSRNLASVKCDGNIGQAVEKR